MYSHILFPTDGSENADCALKAVLTFAELYQAKVTVFHALQIPYPSTAPALGLDFSDSMHKMTEILTENARELVKKTVAKIQAKGLRVDSILTHAEPREALNEVLQEQEVDLIIMGSRGLNILQRSLLGSMSTYMLNHLHGVPLLVVPLPQV